MLAFCRHGRRARLDREDVRAVLEGAAVLVGVDGELEERVGAAATELRAPPIFTVGLPSGSGGLVSGLTSLRRRRRRTTRRHSAASHAPCVGEPGSLHARVSAVVML